ncbi:hypothetical protein K438DRAFT_1786941 [Mycena galopus ATCC 62051]|nr:hypothetical protein K438DRAFT_1786941 [Mycena galopus ATCC 62051]
MPQLERKEQNLKRKLANTEAAAADESEEDEEVNELYFEAFIQDSGPRTPSPSFATHHQFPQLCKKKSKAASTLRKGLFSELGARGTIVPSKGLQVDLFEVSQCLSFQWQSLVPFAISPSPIVPLSIFIPSYGAGHVVNGTVSTWLAGVQLWHSDTLLSQTRKGVSKLAPASSRRLPLDPVSHNHMSALRSALNLVRRKYPGFHCEKCLRFPDSIPTKNETRWFAGPSHWIASKTSTRVRSDVGFGSGGGLGGRILPASMQNPRTIPTPVTVDP